MLTGVSHQQPFSLDSLPVFDNVLTHKHQYQRAQQDGCASFARVVRVSPPNSVSDLQEFLQLTERHFALLQKAGLPVVPHLWGLVKEAAVPERQRYAFRDYRQSVLPHSYFLAAEVAVIHPIPPDEIIPEDVFFSYISALSAYQTQAQRSGETLCDLGPSQLSFGSIDASIDVSGGAGYWLHDLEPIFLDTVQNTNTV